MAKLFSIFLIFTLLFINIEITSADTLLGKLTLIGTDGSANVYPLVSGNKIAYGQRALIRVAGGTLVVEEGSDLIVAGLDENLAFRIENGVIHFRIQPHRTVISFNTRNGNFKTPGVVKAASSMIEGKIAVSRKETVLELYEGSMQALTAEGIETVESGKRKVLVAQADLEESPGGENGPTNSASTSPCSDGIDNDNDGFVDFPDDPGCESADDVNEANYGLTGAAVFGGVTAAAITGAIIGASTSGGGDRRASPIQ